MNLGDYLAAKGQKIPRPPDEPYQPKSKSGKFPSKSAANKKDYCDSMDHPTNAWPGQRLFTCEVCHRGFSLPDTNTVESLKRDFGQVICESCYCK